MFKYTLIMLSFLIANCGVKNDVIPPEKPWVIFKQSKKPIQPVQKTDEKSKKGNKKNVNK